MSQTYYNGIRYVKDGVKSAPLNLSNIEYIPYATWKNMTDAEKAETGVVIVEGYPEDGESVSVTGNGVKTLSQLLNELQAKIDYSKITIGAVLEQRNQNEYTRYRLSQKSGQTLNFDRGRVWLTSTYPVTLYTFSLQPNNSHVYHMFYTEQDGVIIAADDEGTPTSDMTFTFYYGSAGFDASNNDSIKEYSFTANTQSNGAIELPSAIQDKKILGFGITSIPSGYGEAGGWFVKSTNGKHYFMCKDASGSALANVQVGITFYYS